jgi:Kdo2-lipid IVA lauroyltransferase/acyltransferase
MAKRGKLQTFLEYSVARSVLTTLGYLPPSVAMGIGRAVGGVAYVFARDLRRTAETNLRLAFPEKSDEERAQLVRGCFDSLGRLLGFFSQMSSRSEAELKDLIDVQGWENLETEREVHGQKLLLYTGHLGAWELTSFGFSLLGHKFVFLVRRIDNPMIEQMVDRVRTRFGNQTIDKLSAGREMLRILRHGKTSIGLLPDLNTLDDEAIFVDFFGVPAATTFLFAKFALRTNTPIIPVFSPWDEEKGKYLIVVEKPVTFERTDDEEENVRRLTIGLTQRIESQIRRYPNQWLWVHKRWKTRPSGEPKIY